MLDTVVLTLDRHEFEIGAPDRFSPSARGLLVAPYYRLGGRATFHCVLNPSKQDLAAGRYGPRLTLSKRMRSGGFSVTLRIEFSAPKLLFGNNFDELAARDFEAVLAALHRCLRAADIQVAPDMLRGARVSAIHYGKNIAFIDHTTCSMVMGELERIDLDRRLDLARTDYRNEGHAIRYHANSYEVTFYDKLKDLAQARISEKRAIERDSGPQLHLLNDRAELPRELEVLRMEVRLGTRGRIAALVTRIEPGTEPTFAALFSAGIAKGVLLHFWSRVRAQMPLVEGVRDRRPEDLLADLARAADGKARAGTLLQRLGCLMLVGSIGFRGADAVLLRHCTPRTWQRYRRLLKGLPVPTAARFSALRQVDEALARFEVVRMASFQAMPPTRGPGKEPRFGIGRPSA